MSSAPADDLAAACSSLAVRARSAARELECLLSGRPDAAVLHQLRLLVSRLQQLGTAASHLETQLREGRAVSPELQRMVLTEVLHSNDTASALIKQLMRLGPDTPADTISESTVLLYETFAEATTRYLEFVTSGVLAVDSVEAQETHIHSQHARHLLDAAVSARLAITPSSCIVLENTHPGHDLVTSDDSYDSKPPAYAAYDSAPPPFEEAPAVPSLRQPGADSGGAKSRGTTLLDSLISPLRAATAALRTKPEPLVSALCQAAAAGSESQIRALLAAGANIDGQDEGGRTALINAIQAGQLDSMRILLESGADVSRPDSRSRCVPPLFHAVDRQSRPAADLLLAHGADPAQTDDYGQGYFLALITDGAAPEWIDFLLSHGADPGAQDVSGQAAAVLALKRRRRRPHTQQQRDRDDGREDDDREEVVRLLLRHGAHADTRDTDGTPLTHMCLKRKRRGLALELLSRWGADSNARDVSGISLLEAAVGEGDVEVVRTLLEKGADPNVRLLHGYHLLFSVLSDGARAKNAHPDAVAVLLLQHGARGELRDFYGVSALEHALAPLIRTHSTTKGPGPSPSSSPPRDRIEVPELLFKQGANPNQRLTKVPGEPTVLAFAVEHGLSDLAALALRYGAEVKQGASEMLRDVA